ncbi:MAG: TetR-like C-terminal domain-containing protein [Chloroflexi bacterium]|nr:TetR-like C-terminal domain-containing protein [Chloroflexota bacterium]
MYHIKDDQRSIRSSEMIYKGLVALMGEKDFATITVSDLVDAAKVGRTTFYRNFDEIEDVLRMRNDQVVEGFLGYLQTYRQTHRDESPTTILKPVLRYFYLHSELVELLMKAKRIYIFEEAMLNRFEPFKSMFGAFYGVEEIYVDYVMAVRIGGVTNILIHWIETGKKQAPDELADKLGAIFTNMVPLEQLL